MSSTTRGDQSDICGPRPAVGICVVIPAWGERVIRDFLDVVLPLQLAPGNLPALTDRPTSTYVIYTRQSDVAFFLDSPTYLLLCRVVKTELRVIEKPIGASPYQTMSDCYRDALAKTRHTDLALVFLAADSIIADGTIATLCRLADAGKRCVFVAGLRVTQESFGANVRERRGEVHGAVSIPPREMTQLALDHLHPMAASHYWDSDTFNIHPSHLYWKVESEGILARCFHLHPIMVRPANRDVTFAVTIDDDYIVNACPDPDTIHVVTDSDEISAFSMAPGDQRIGCDTPRRSSFASLAKWSDMFLKPQHIRLAETPVYIHAGQQSPCWQIKVRQSSEVLSDIRAIATRSTAFLFFVRPNLFVDRELYDLMLRADANSAHILNQLRERRAKRNDYRDKVRSGEGRLSLTELLADRKCLLGEMLVIANFRLRARLNTGSLLISRFGSYIAVRSDPDVVLPSPPYFISRFFQRTVGILRSLWINRAAIKNLSFSMLRGDAQTWRRARWRSQQILRVLFGRPPR